MNWLGRVRTSWKQLKNERLYRRLSTDLPVKITLESENEPRMERIGNWSPGGLFISTANALPMETNVQMEFSLGAEEASCLRLSGQVVRHQKNGTNGECEGMGIMFTDFSESGWLVLRELLTKAYTETIPISVH